MTATISSPRAVLLLVATSCLLCSPARAHENTRAYGELALQPGPGTAVQLALFARYEDWDQAVGKLDLNQDGRLDNGELARQAKAVNGWLAGAVTGTGDGAACPAEIQPPAVAVRGRDLYLRSLLTFRCERQVAAFTLRYDLFARLHPGHRLIASVRTDGGEATHIFATHPERVAEHTLVLRAPVGWVAMLGQGVEFAGLGVKHILIGYDHLLFLLALLLASASRRELLLTVTAFTAAHSVTLAAAVLQLVQPPAAIVEPAIALSIVLVAAQNLFLGARLARGRYLVTFALGLLHGFGFAGVLLELGVGRGALVASLLGFNLGVELGQLALVLVSYPALAWLRRQPFRMPALRAVSAFILAAGLFWFAGRLPI